MLSRSAAVGIVGAGAMGTGIAQVALLAGHEVLLGDASGIALEKAQRALEAALQREVEKGRLDAATAAAARARLSPILPDEKLAPYDRCAIVIEAVHEDLDTKRSLFAALEEVIAPDCVLATNTSSLSVGAIAAACRRPERVIGTHFFNPAPVMPLVEVVPALRTSGDVLTAVKDLMKSWGKTIVVASDTPGFIVNRIARPFYGEALCIVEDASADVATVDWAARELAGFKMGPFELMDFIGNDVNYAVTESIWRGTYFDARYRPSLVQKRLVEAGYLGRKTGRGFYDYAAGVEPPRPRQDRTLGEAIVQRILAMLINEAVDAVRLRIATVSDVELAMTKGVHYPKGLLAWGEELGFGRVLAELERLRAEFGSERYRPSPLLRQLAVRGRAALEELE